MEMRIYPVTWALARPFGISRGVRSQVQNVIVELHQDGWVGIGEAAPNARYGESQSSAIAFLESLDLRGFELPEDLDRALDYVNAHAPGEFAAKAAVDIALHDLWAQLQGLPLYRLWGLNPRSTLQTSFTIGIDTPEVIEEKVREAERFPILKVKLGTPYDEEIIRTIRRLTDRTLRVDANEGWERKEALEKICWLADQNVELVEQPLPAGRWEDQLWLQERSPLPIVADESVQRPEDVARAAEAFDGINVKLMKCGGLREARRLIQAARQRGLRVMIGCMLESAVAATAGALLTPLADWADLDGPLLLAQDLFEGVQVTQAAYLRLPEGPGLGVRRRPEFPWPP
ncbi:MAG: dipeptide epimerase [Bacteroidetes bacterium]|nr:dipeptide epimerase [Rhodothermia bacterium]MCX7907083.1 dipeptide epimerase [Bacteroidota bacterium]MDW8285493.1 dipeptide epimerase [Bacteroidota bacterium]